MAKKTIPLSDTNIRKAKPKENDYKLFDGNGLFLLVRKSGKKTFVVRFKFNGKETQKTLGEYPIVTLAKAREKLQEVKRMLVENKNPNEDTKHKVREYSLDDLADLFFDFKSKSLSENYLQKQKSRYSYFVKKQIGFKLAKEISKRDIIDTINNIPNVKTRNTKQTDMRETMRIILHLINNILKYGNMNDLINNSSYLHLDKNSIIPPRKNIHYKAVTNEKEFKLIYSMLNEYQGDIITKYALIFLAHTALRSHNIRFLKWDNIYYKERIIIFSADEMKTKQEFRMPITDFIYNLLKEVQEFSDGKKYVFSSDLSKNKILSENTLLYALKRMEIFNHSPHGFRSSFSTICYENHKLHGFSSEVIESQLAHNVGNKVKLAYLRSDFLQERRELMKWWDEWLIH